MPLSPAEHRVVSNATRAARAAGKREHRASGGPTYRKVPVAVRIVDVPDETDPTTGEHLQLATSDTPSEQGRYFRVWREGGRWKCRCASFQALNGCHHVGHLQATDVEAAA